MMHLIIYETTGYWSEAYGLIGDTLAPMHGFFYVIFYFWEEKKTPHTKFGRLVQRIVHCLDLRRTIVNCTNNLLRGSKKETTESGGLNVDEEVTSSDRASCNSSRPNSDRTIKQGVVCSVGEKTEQERQVLPSTLP